MRLGQDRPGTFRTLDRMAREGDVARLRAYLEKHPDIRPDGWTLGLAARFGGPDIVELLLSKGASFEHIDNTVPFVYDHSNRGPAAGLFVLPFWEKGVKPVTEPLTDAQYARTLQLLHESGTGSFPLMLYLAILEDDQRTVHILHDLGEFSVPESVRNVLNGQGSGRNRILPRFTEALGRIAYSQAAVVRFLENLSQDPGIDRIHLTQRAVRSSDYRGSGPPYSFWFGPDVFRTAVRTTDLLSSVRPRELIEGLQEAGNLTGLLEVDLAKYLKTAPRLEEMQMALKEVPDVPADVLAPVLTLQQERSSRRRRTEGQGLSLGGDSLSVKAVSMLWTFRNIDTATAVLVSYKGTGTHVAVPPRIGRRTVVSVAPAPFRYRAALQERVGESTYPPVTSITFPGSVSIVPEDMCRDGGTKLTSFAGSAGTTHIGAGAFEGCEELTEVELPDTLLSIGGRAFQGCSRLKTIPLPAHLETIGFSAFQSSGLGPAIDLPPALKTIESYGLAWTQLETIVVPPGVEQIGAGAFEGCKGLRDVVFQGLPDIQHNAFRSCSSLRSIELPENITRIARRMFESSGLWNIGVPAGVREIGEAAFQNVSGLKQMELPSSLEVIDSSAFERSGLRHISIPDTVKEIGHNAFAGSALETVSVSGRAELGRSVFQGCSSLVEVSLCDTLKALPADTFRRCSALRGIDLPACLEDIGPAAFQNAGLRHVRMPSGVTRIQSGAFAECADLTHVVLPPSLGKLGRSAFAGAALEEASIPDSVWEMGREVFAGCARLRQVSFGTLRSIPEGTCKNCTALQTAEIPDTVEVIGRMAFAGSGLVKVVIPESVRRIEANAFAGCADLREVVLKGEGSLTIGGDAFAKCSSLESLIVKRTGFLKIGRGAFADSSSLQKVQIDAEKCEIGEAAFDHSGIASFSVAGTCTIEAEAFRSCHNLRELHLPPQAHTGPGAFFDCRSLANDEGHIVVGGVWYGQKDVTRQKRGYSVSTREISADQIAWFPEGTVPDKHLLLPEIVLQHSTHSQTPSMPDFSALQPGDRVPFGYFPQEAGFEPEPIEWIAVRKEKDRVLLISSRSLLYCIDVHSNVTGRPGWGSSRPRRMLNSVFLQAAFSDGECRRIVPSSHYAGSDDRNCTDEVFLLSWAELHHAAPVIGPDGAPTAYAAARAANYTYASPEDEIGFLLRPDADTEQRWAKHRSRGNGWDAAVVEDGRYRRKSQWNGYLRPALWAACVPEQTNTGRNRTT